MMVREVREVHVGESTHRNNRGERGAKRNTKVPKGQNVARNTNVLIEGIRAGGPSYMYIVYMYIHVHT